MKINKPFNIQLSSRLKKFFGLTSTSPGKQSIEKFYGIGSESYGEKESSHFLILKDQPIPLPIKLSQDGNSQAESDYLLSAPFLEGPDVETRDENIIDDINMVQISEKLGMTLEEKIAGLTNPGQDNEVVPEDLGFLAWEDVIKNNRINVKGKFLQEATKQRKSGSSLITGLEVQASYASSQSNSGIDLARQQQLPRSLSRIKFSPSLVSWHAIIEETERLEVLSPRQLLEAKGFSFTSELMYCTLDNSLNLDRILELLRTGPEISKNSDDLDSLIKESLLSFYKNKMVQHVDYTVRYLIDGIQPAIETCCYLFSAITFIRLVRNLYGGGSMI